MAAWVGRRRQIQDQQRPEHWFTATSKPIVATTAAGSSALAVESRAAPTTVHELQPHQSVTSSSSAVINNRRSVVVVSNNGSKKSASGGGGSSEYQLQFAWPVNKSIKKMPESLDGVFQQGQQHHYHHQQQSNNNNNNNNGMMEREAAGLSSSNRGREEMYLRQYGGMVTNKQSDGDGAEAGGEQQQQPASRRRRYKTEYKKNFRPFSLYQYVDGQFCKASATAGDQQQPQQQQQHLEKGDPWYHEVLELRKKAGEYKFRGLGGELMPQHMVDLYAKQMDVWEQVSRRSSLSALSLAATTPRSASSEKASAANTRRSSPAKTVPQSARPGHAQPLLSNSRKENTSSPRSSQINSQSAERPRRELSQQRSISTDGKTRAKSAKPSKSSSTGPNAPNVQVAIRPSLGAIFHPVNKAPTRSASVGPERRVPKSNSSASTMRSTPVKGRHDNTTTINDGGNEVAAVKPVPKNVNNKKPTDEIKENEMMTDGDNKEDTDPMALPMDIIPATAVTAEDEEPLPALIKAAPEPTRVKSPEQLLVRSPEPVNWTVPLDTGKTFTVTQNIRGGEGSRPHSELKVSMTVRPSPTPPVVVQSNNSSSETTGNGPTMPVESAVDDEVKGAASPPPVPATAATVTATRPVKAPGTPPHDSLGYFSEPEVIVECCSPSSELSEI